MSTMKRLAWKSRESWRMVEDEAPIPKAPCEGALVKVTWAGICRSDLSAAKDNWFAKLPTPMVFGHEICGKIEEFGSSVNKGSIDLSEGDNVIVFGPSGCGKCAMCLGGSQFCFGDELRTMGRFYGLGTDGGFQQYLEVILVKDLIKVPTGVPCDLASILPCSGLTAINAIDHVRASIDERTKILGKATLLVVGSGGLGLWAMQIARSIWGNAVQICVADITEEKLALAKKNGADTTVLWEVAGDPGELAKKTREVCGGGVDACTDFVNNTFTVATAIGSLNRNGTLAQVGIVVNVTMPPIDLRIMPLMSFKIVGVTMGTKKQLANLLQMILDKKCPDNWCEAGGPNCGVHPIDRIDSPCMQVTGPPITHVSLWEVNDVFEKLLQSALEGRAIVDMEKTFT